MADIYTSIGDQADAILAPLDCAHCGSRSGHDLSRLSDGDDYSWHCHRCGSRNWIEVRVTPMWYVSEPLVIDGDDL